jgi:hypothetical protein
VTCGRSGQNRFSNLLRFQLHPVFGHYALWPHLATLRSDAFGMGKKVFSYSQCLPLPPTNKFHGSKMGDEGRSLLLHPARMYGPHRGPQRAVFAANSPIVFRSLPALAHSPGARQGYFRIATRSASQAWVRRWNFLKLEAFTTGMSGESLESSHPLPSEPRPLRHPRLRSVRLRIKLL